MPLALAGDGAVSVLHRAIALVTGRRDHLVCAPAMRRQPRQSEITTVDVGPSHMMCQAAMISRPINNPTFLGSLGDA
jgi:hypothetical protein